MDLDDIDKMIENKNCKVKLFLLHKKRKMGEYEMKAFNPSISDKLAIQNRDIVHNEVVSHNKMPCLRV